MVSVPRSVRRPAFTLIELLVVIGIMIFLFGLTVAFLPAVYQRDGATRGGQIVQAALAEARQRARRDKLNTGIRFTGNAALDANLCTNLTWIQQPIDLTGGVLSAAKGNTNAVQIAGADLSRVMAGDHLIINNSGVPHRILQPPVGTAVTLYAPLPYPIPATQDYRIIRQPAPMLNQPSVSLPGNVAVDFRFGSFDAKTVLAKDMALYTMVMTNNPPGIDVVFSPNGSVTGQWAGIDRIILYVRDYKDPDPKAGSPTVVCILVRTGLISVHPADVGGAHPYTFCDSCRSSGL